MIDYGATASDAQATTGAMVLRQPARRVGQWRAQYFGDRYVWNSN
jgi:hypothetical protein